MDIGTNSVGMACTDENYNLLKVKGQKCWTVRLFDKAETAANRRQFRSTRRRLQRRRNRILLLQSLFAPYMTDECFFIRLNNSQFFTEDKDGRLNGDKNTLFADKTFSDRDFYKKYPTIYHLRSDLQKGGISDIRLYYLAIHHIIKYRGHFLFEGEMQDIHDISKLFDELNDVCERLYGESFTTFGIEKANDAKQILLNRKLKIRELQEELQKLFGFYKNKNDAAKIQNKDDAAKKQKEIIKGICGAKISPKELFGDKYSEEKSFSIVEKTSEEFEALQLTYGDDFDLLNAIRSICNYIKFEKILGESENISQAMISLYDKHKADLKKLKGFIKDCAPDKYNEIFRKYPIDTKQKADNADKNTDRDDENDGGKKKDNKKLTNYVAYVGYTKTNKKEKVEKCKKEEFFVWLKKLLCSLPEQAQSDERCKEIINELEAGTFLQKILHADNGVFPHQINEQELNKIIECMVEDFPQTKEISEKIKQIFNFRIPYYVGPLTGKNCWVVKNSEEKITPWNFEEVVNKAASNEAFMRNMTNKCTYLTGEDVLPKASILYQKFNCLNQLNKLKINEVPLKVEQKQALFNELFLKYNKVIDGKIKDFCRENGWVGDLAKDDITISGKDEDIKATMSSYIQLKKILGDFVDEDLQKSDSVCEKIILWHTLNTDKKVVEGLILKNYGNIPQIRDNIAALKGLTFKNFGRLSQRLLTGLCSIDKETGELVTIMDLLWNTNQNFNEILFDEKYDFERLIEEENGERDTKITYSDIENLYVSPAVRRGIWQSLCMADEYIKAVGREPDKIFVEVTREEGKKEKVPPRKKQLLEKYQEVEGFSDIEDQLRDEKITDLALRQERLFLYFRQLGRCMYSGEQIDLSALNTDTYDVDHILPRTFIKDDSLDNKVLVKRVYNAQKSDTYPLPQKFFKQQDHWNWKLLRKKNLISDKTYNLLTRTAPLDDDDYKGFINRQKVITDQIAKAVANLLERKYPNSEIVYSKAKNVSDFRQQFDIVKCRETNDFHHARDAYLNVVVGNVYHTCFSVPYAPYRKDGDKWRQYNLKKLFVSNHEDCWNSERDITTVKNTVVQSSMMVTRYAYSKKGEFYDQTIYSHKDKAITAPRKAGSALNDTSKYGGYKSQNTAYFAIVKSIDKKGKIKKTIEVVPVLVAYNAKQDVNALQKYFESYLIKPEILVDKLKIKQLVSYNGKKVPYNDTKVHLAGITGNYIVAHNAEQLITDSSTDKYVKALIKLAKLKKEGSEIKPPYIICTNRTKEIKLEITKEQNLQTYNMFIEKLGKKSYSGISPYNSFRENLINGKDKFCNLEVLDQVDIIIEILKFFSCDAQTANIKKIGGSEHSGKILFNKDITDVDFRIIRASYCGLFKREQKI